MRKNQETVLYKLVLATAMKRIFPFAQVYNEVRKNNKRSIKLSCYSHLLAADDYSVMTVKKSLQHKTNESVEVEKQLKIAFGNNFVNFNHVTYRLTYKD